MGYIDVTDLSHQYPNGYWGLHGVRLTIERGEFIIVAGKNGSGKTTFCRHLNGLLKPTSGSVVIDGLRVEKDPAQARQKVGMVFQNADAQIVGETVYTDIAFGPENLGLERSEIDLRVQSTLLRTGLNGREDQSPHTLSGGEKRKLAIAGVLAMNPEVLVFDEPFSNLDYPGSLQILKQILNLHQSGQTIILVTHELEKAIAHASRLVVFEAGKVVMEGPPQTAITDVERFGVRQPCSAKLGHGIQSWLI